MSQNVFSKPSTTTINPANLRWKYLLERIRDDEILETEKLKYSRCIDSLIKFPLVLTETVHCRMLQNFNSEIISKMNAKLTENEQNCRHDDEISPIGRQNSVDNNNDVAKRLNVSQQEVSFCDLTKDDSEDDYERQRKLREEQIEKDHQLALRLSLEGDNIGMDLGSDSDPDQFNITAKVAGLQKKEVTQVVPHSNVFTLSPNPAIRKPLREAWESSDSDEDPFGPGPSKKPKKIPPAKKLTQEPCQVKKVTKPRTAASSTVTSSQAPTTSNVHSISDSDDDIESSSASQRPSVFDMDPVFSRFAGAFGASPEPKKTPKKASQRKKATKLQDASNGSSQSQSAGRARSSSQSQALNRPRAGSTLSHAAGSVSSQVHTISDSDDEMEPTSRPPSFLTQDPVFSQITAELNKSSEPKKTKKPRRRKDDTEIDLSQGSQSSGQKSRGEYCPNPRSASYAILVSLYYESQKPTWKGFVSKAEAIKLAQPLTDTDMSFSKPGSYGAGSHYTGWSSSKTLFKKGLLKSWSNPKRIKLTDSGYALAEKLIGSHVEALSIHTSQTADNSRAVNSTRGAASSSGSAVLTINSSQTEANNQPGNNSRSATTSSGSAVFADASWLKDVSLGAQPQLREKPKQLDPDTNVPNGQFLYCYVTDSGQESGDQADSKLGYEDSVAYLIKCRKTDLEQSGKRFRIERDFLEGQPGMCLAYLNESDCQDKVQIPDWHGAKQLNSPITSPPKKQAKKKSCTPKAKASEPRKNSKAKTAESSVAPVSLSPDFFTDIPSEWNISENSVVQSSSHPVNGNSGFILRSGQYDIMLLVDNMEVTGGAHGGKKSRKAAVLEEFEAQQVNFECRKLSIGDFVWIARERVGGGQNPRELVLPYIVERKRMDDLRSSIMDGRYKEQKSRLNQSGVKIKFYLVEEAGLGGLPASCGAKALDRSALDQAISNTCIRDGFRIKRSRNQKESCTFLSVFTRILTEKYSGLDLKSTTLANIGQVSDWSTNLLPYKDFYEHARSDKPMSIREVFSNMLISQKMVTPAMAWAITQKYPTPKILNEAFKNSEDQEKLLLGLPYESGKKKISSAVSRTISLLFNETNLK